VCFAHGYDEHKIQAVRAVDRWRALTGDERRLTLLSAALVTLVAAALPFINTARLMRAASAPVRASQNQIRPDQWIAAMDRAARYVPGATCLAQSIGLAWLLRRRGVDVVVKIGARRGSGFAAHAWLEYEGRPLTPDSDDGGPFTVMVGS
jgi:hypothetical protein